MTFSTIRAVAVLLLGSSSVWAAPPMVQLGSATLIGREASVPQASPANAYLGIPFAEPPKRFSPPKPLVNFSGTYDATAYKAACVQEGSAIPAWDPESPFDPVLSYNATQSEDCLHLNVYTPQNATQSSGLPVLFFIYGGNLQTGNGDRLSYDASRLAAEHNIVAVVINYRVSVFGFTPSDELEVTKRNPGFLDQRMALAWVRENIHAFGGDCEKITIQGQSAGGYSVKNLWALPPTPLPFRAAIMESQALLAPPGSGWDKLMNLINCTDAASQIACAQAVDAQTIATLAVKNLLFFPPTVDNVTHIDHVERAIFKKAPARVPLLIGTNGNEVGEYVALLQSSNVSTATFTSLLPGSPQLFNALLEAQAKQTGDPASALIHVLNQYLFTCGNRALASLAALNGYPTWRYLYNGTFAAFDLVPGGESHGATHSSELPIVFGTYPTGNTHEHDRLAALSEYVRERWMAFVKDPVGGLEWPGYFSGPAEDVLLIGNGGAVNGTVVSSGVVDYDCALYEQWIIGAGTV